MLERPAPAAFDAATQWIATPGLPRQPWFAWVHLYDPHEPYDPPEPYRSRFAADPYAGEIAFADAALGAALAALASRGALARTARRRDERPRRVARRSQERTHGLFAYDATLRVPLVLWAPRRHRAGRADGTGTARRRAADGARSRRRAIVAGETAAAGVRRLSAARRSTPVDVYFEALNANLTRNWAPLTGLVANGLKFIDLPMRGALRPWRRPRRADEPVRGAGAPRPTRSRGGSFALRARGKPAAPAAVDRRDRAAPALARLPRDARRRRPDAPSPPPTIPKRSSACTTQLDDALAAVKGGRAARWPSGCCKQLIATARPDFVVAHDRLAQLYRDTGRLRLAVATLEASSTAGHADAASLAALGGYLQEAGNLERSVQVLEAARWR